MEKKKRKRLWEEDKSSGSILRGEMGERKETLGSCQN
jgi:hypothetical protein